MNELILATTNPHKLDECRAILAPAGVALRSLADLPGPFPEPDENGETFQANATIKALAYARMTGRRVLADDSGLEADALAGEPGVHSAYYAGRDGTRAERDQRNNAKLLHELRGVPPHLRTARYVCVMALADPSAQGRPEPRVIAITRGEFPVLVGTEPRGRNGFGYDPLMRLPADGRSVAELTDDEKNALSHRGAAARAMAQRLRELPPR
ncbi:MAG: non-canonical purine NTP pyrophosphatase [Phycisphaerales bacterium]|nr:non-canonical purine NTP pyrophosphatase [Phycisphaerales bacterium]